MCHKQYEIELTSQLIIDRKSYMMLGCIVGTVSHSLGVVSDTAEAQNAVLAAVLVTDVAE